jgi:hypothetical protein
VAAINDYETLKIAVGEYLGRDDLVDFIPNFIQNCESTLYKKLRIRAMENALSVTTSGGVAALPTSPAFIELKYAYVSASPVISLSRVPVEQIYSLHPNRTVSGNPRFIAVDGGNFVFGPYPSNGLTINGTYYGRLDPLSGANPTNWFTSYAPDLLLYGALIEAEPFLAGDARMATWNSLYQRAYDAVSTEERKQQMSGGKLSTRIS